MRTLVFDIETAAYPEALLREMVDQERPFDPGQVALGNARKEETVAAKVAEARAAHGDDIVRWAALDSGTAMVCAIGHLMLIEGREPDGPGTGGDDIPGAESSLVQEAQVPTIQIMGRRGPISYEVVRSPDGGVVLATWTDGMVTEADVLTQFWRDVDSVDRLVGYNSHGFDLPFLFQRSVMLGVRASGGLRDRRWWTHRSVDLRDWWTSNARGHEVRLRHGLDGLARSLGIAGKNGSGADFARLWWSGSAAEHDQAQRYLEHDIEMTVRAYRRMRACLD